MRKRVGRFDKRTFTTWFSSKNQFWEEKQYWLYCWTAKYVPYYCTAYSQAKGMSKEVEIKIEQRSEKQGKPKINSTIRLKRTRFSFFPSCCRVAMLDPIFGWFISRRNWFIRFQCKEHWLISRRNWFTKFKCEEHWWTIAKIEWILLRVSYWKFGNDHTFLGTNIQLLWKEYTSSNLEGTSEFSLVKELVLMWLTKGTSTYVQSDLHNSIVSCVMKKHNAMSV